YEGMATSSSQGDLSRDRRGGPRAGESVGSPDVARDSLDLSADGLARDPHASSSDLPELRNPLACAGKTEAHVAKPGRASDHVEPQVRNLSRLRDGAFSPSMSNWG